MITTEKLQNYVKLCPKASTEKWDITKDHLKDLEIRLPDNWVERALIQIESTIIDTVRDFKETKKSIRWHPSLYFNTLYGYQHVNLTKREADIIAEEMKKYGYTLSSKEEWKDYFSYAISW